MSRRSTLRSTVARLMAHTQSTNTRRAYAADLRHFRAAGHCVPCTAKTLVEYLARYAGVLGVSTLQRRLVAIRHAHKQLGVPSPTNHVSVKQLMRGIKRTYGVQQRQAKPLLAHELAEVVKRMGRQTVDERDRALLLMGFAGAFRRSELVRLRAEDLERTNEGLFVRLVSSKTDQERKGRIVAVPCVRGPLCAVCACGRWLVRAGIRRGPVFQRLDVHGKPLGVAIADAAVSDVLRRRLALAGIDPRGYSAHSLRAGLVTAAAKAGVPGWKIRQQTGHRSEAVLARYIRDVDMWTGNAAALAVQRRLSRPARG